MDKIITISKDDGTIVAHATIDTDGNINIIVGRGYDSLIVSWEDNEHVISN